MVACIVTDHTAFVAKLRNLLEGFLYNSGYEFDKLLVRLA